MGLIIDTSFASANMLNNPGTLGAVTKDDATGKVWKLVQFKDAVTYAATQVVEWADAACTTVTNDRVGGSSIGNFAAGVCPGVKTQNYYGYIQVGGPATVKTASSSITAGLALLSHSTVDGSTISAAANAMTTAIVGVATAAESAGAVTVMLTLGGY